MFHQTRGWVSDFKAEKFKCPYKKMCDKTLEEMCQDEGFYYLFENVHMLLLKNLSNYHQVYNFSCTSLNLNGMILCLYSLKGTGLNEYI